jgi:hypothetical protein
MQAVNTDQMTFTDARHMPIVKEYARQIGLVETIDQMVDTQMELSPGIFLEDRCCYFDNFSHTRISGSIKGILKIQISG